MSKRINALETTEKPWGKEILVEKNEVYALKDIYMNAGTRSSLQSHEMKLETIYVLSGKIELETINETGEVHLDIYQSNEAYTIPPGCKHRVKVLEDCRLVEISTPHLDDVIRHQDDYNRSIS